MKGAREVYLSSMLLVSVQCFYMQHVVSTAMKRHKLYRQGSVMVVGLDFEVIEAKKKAAAKRLIEAQTAAEDAADEQKSAERVVAKKAVLAQEAAEQLMAVQALAAKAAAEQAAAAEERAAAEKMLAERLATTQAAMAELKAAQAAVDSAADEQAAWEQENPLEATGKVAIEIGAVVGAELGTALLTSLFGESKAAREAREAEEAVEKAAVDKSARVQHKDDAERAVEEMAAPEKAAVEEAEKIAADKMAGEKATSEKVAGEAADKVVVDNAAQSKGIDAELRRKRQEAEVALKNRRPRKLTETVSTAAADSALAAAAAAAEAAKNQGGTGSGLEVVASWATEAREKLRVETERKEKFNRMSLFESDLTLLGLTIEEAVNVDEKSLRKAFRNRSLVLHPDMRAQRRAEDAEGIPSVYELNAAFEAVRKLL
mmetsp:Transcript_32292/g.53380  ORF Transcript_32292/g.53380 Transcript_32292/m.53380 type:complete len:430 (+) Transcript_32292:119-1408(+)